MSVGSISNHALLTLGFTFEQVVLRQAQELSNLREFELAFQRERPNQLLPFTGGQGSFSFARCQNAEVVDCLKHPEPLGDKQVLGRALFPGFEFAVTNRVRVEFQRTLMKDRLAQFRSPVGPQCVGMMGSLGVADGVEFFLVHIAGGPCLGSPNAPLGRR